MPDRRGKAKRSEIWEKTYGAARGILCTPKAMARPENIRQGGSQTVGNHPQHLFEMGKGKQRMKKYSLRTAQKSTDITAFHYIYLTNKLQVLRG